MNAGQYDVAGPLFERCAVDCHRAGDLLAMKLNAALSVKSFAMGADGANAARVAVATVDALAAAGRVPEIPGFAAKALESMRIRHLAVVADEVSRHVGTVVGSAWNDPAAIKLPAFCTSCGAPVRPAEVTRPTPSTAACNYCGGSLAG